MTVKLHNGKKIIVNDTIGCLYIGVLKKLYWKYFNAYFDGFLFDDLRFFYYESSLKCFYS